VRALHWTVAALAAGTVVSASSRSAEPTATVPAHAPMDTRCGACHSPESWSKVTFDHDRTGFPLLGRHAAASCSACHASIDFSAAVPRSCAACHRDAHAGEFGTRCGTCHDPESWRSRFDADAHRRTNFPLTGRHALIPCEECHQDQRDRRFTRATVDCGTCHQADYLRAATISIDHIAAGFGTNCRDCHNPWSFRAARFPAHDRCFQLAPGPHAGISCLDCHTTLTGTLATGACATNTAACTRCHTCPTAQQQHRQVAGFQCRDRKCYECHQFTARSARVPARSGR
jgi:Class III cytochrome C family